MKVAQPGALQSDCQLRACGVVAAPATERGLQSAGLLGSEAGFGILRGVCAVITFLRDKSRAPAAILVGALNTYAYDRALGP
jgi:hypothetical protein